MEKVSRAVKKATYDPAKNYAWEPEDKFVLTGLEISNINRALMAAASTPEFQKSITVYNGLLSFQKFFQSAVEEGLIKEQESPKSNGQIEAPPQDEKPVEEGEEESKPQ